MAGARSAGRMPFMSASPLNRRSAALYGAELTQPGYQQRIAESLIPLDCTNNVPLTQDVFDQIANHRPQTIVTKLFKQTFGPTIQPNTFIFDTNALGYFIHPEFAMNTQGIWIDVHTTFDVNDKFD